VDPTPPPGRRRNFGGGQSRRNGSPPPRGPQPTWFPNPAARRIYLTPSPETQAHQVGLFFEGEALTENRDGDCGDTNASEARANPRFRPYALWRAVPFASGGFRPGRALSQASTPTRSARRVRSAPREARLSSQARPAGSRATPPSRVASTSTASSASLALKTSSFGRRVTKPTLRVQG
jgi:hypothetical protein